MKAAAKNTLGLLVATAGAAALGLYAWFGVMKPDEQQAEQKAVDEKLVAAHAPGETLPDGGALPPPAFTKISVTSGTGTTVLEKRGDEWFLTKPLEAKADSAAVSQLTRQLETGKVKELLEEKPTAEDLKRYGLDAPRFVVRATTAGDSKEHVIEGGIENTFDGSVFVRKGGGEAVYSAPGAVRAAFTQDLFDLRDKQVLKVPTEEVAKLEVKLGRAGYTLTHDGAQWRLTHPREGAADSETITAMLGALGGERATAFAADVEALRARLPFEKPAVDATFTLRSGGTLRLRLAEAKSGDLYALREQDGQAPVLANVNESALSHLRKSFEDLRDKTILRFDREAVARLVVHRAEGEPLELTKEITDAGASDAWRITKPEPGKAQGWKVASLLWSLTALKAKDVVEEKPQNLGRYGLERPAKRLELLDADGKALATLAIGTAAKGDATRVYVLNAQGTLFDAEKSRLDDLPLTPADIAEKPPAVSADAGVASTTPN